MQLEQVCLIHIIKCILHEEENVYEMDFPDEIDFGRLYRIAKQHSVANMVAFSICKNTKVTKDVIALFEEQRVAILRQHVFLKRAILELYEIIQKAKVKGIILKGAVLRDYYPNPFMRSMSDIDVYMEKEDIEKIGDMMVKCGFNEGVIGRSNHYEYIKYGVAKIELHPELVALDSAYGKNVYSRLGYQNTSIAQKLKIWSHTESINGRQYAVKLEPEYHYVYIIMHMMNHFLTAGTGMRSVIDVWIFNMRYKDKWDCKIVDDLLKEFGLSRFEKYAVALANKWFSYSRELNVDSQIDERVLSIFEDYILTSGTYGNFNNSITSQLKYDTGISSKTALLFKNFFPSYAHMRSAYPIVAKNPILLPIMWGVRMFEILTKRKKLASVKINAIIDADAGRAKIQQDLFSKIM